MTTVIVKADPFTAALATLQADWPAKFTLEVEDYVFRNVGSMAKAQEISWAMERMKAAAIEMGYEVFIENRTLDLRRWFYHFKLRPGFSKPPPARVVSLPPGPKELDEFLDGEAKQEPSTQELPAHLREDAPHVVCARCGRKSWSNYDSDTCDFIQPGNYKCGGIFRLLIP